MPNEINPSTSGGDAGDGGDAENVFPNATSESLIPDPPIFNAYDDKTKEILLGFIDREIRARFDDESHRQDLLTTAEIHQSRRGQFLSVFLVTLAIIAATSVGIIVKDAVMVGAFLALPFAAIIGNLFRPIMTRRDQEI